MSPIALDPPAIARPSHGNNYSSAIPIIDPTAARRPTEAVTVDSPNLSYTDEALVAKYTFHSAEVKQDGQRYSVKPVEKNLELKTLRSVPKTG